MSKKPVMLMILDGYGISSNEEGNAISLAKKPNLDAIFAKYPNTAIAASGMEVGLPRGQMGNSEVGHLNIGAGRVIYQELTRITKQIEDGDFFNNEALVKAVDEAIKNDGALHLMGLLSDGGVHSHIDHLKALIKLAKDKGLTKVFVHGFLDGRDVAPSSGIKFVEDITSYMNEEGVGKVSTLCGRYYAMDRDKRWERVQLAYEAMVLGKGETTTDAVAAVQKSYDENKSDEFVLPTVVVDSEGKAIGTVKNNDSVIFFNYRPDRARELSRALTDVKFDGFERPALNTHFVCMTQYDATMENVDVAFRPEGISNTLGEHLSKLGKTQLRIAETEKYAHVTFFFNGGVESEYPGESRILVPSPKVATYDLQPEMNANELTEKLLGALNEDKYDVIIINYANPDMLGHTGVLEAAITAVQTVDACVGKVVDKVLELDGTVFLTADHGNAEQMIDFSTGGVMTSHTSLPVPFVYISNHSTELNEGGKLADIAPTMLTEMGLEVPKEMTGKSLIK